MRRFMFGLSAVLVMAVLASPVDAQLKLGAQAALTTGVDEASALDGTFGLGGRVMVDPPLLPIGGFVSGTYFFPEGDVSYWTTTAAAQLRLPMPMVKPYALAGWQLRGGEGDTQNGAVLGLGVQLDFMMSVFLEGTYEFHEEITGFPDFDNDPIVIKAGVLFGGS